MTLKLLFVIFIVTLAAACSGEVLAAPAITVVTVPEIANSKKLIALDNGDVLTSGAKFRVIVTVDENGPLIVELEDSRGVKTILHDGPVVAGETIELPKKTKAYELDNLIGSEKIVAKMGQTETVMTISHLSVGSLANAKSKSFNGRSGNAVTKAIDASAAVSSLRSETINLKTALYESVGRLPTGSDPILTRGSQDAKLFSDVAAGVVLIVAKDALGSGTIISSRGDILTNWHVVMGQPTVGVILKPPGIQAVRASDVREARLIKFDEIADLAIVRLSSVPSNLKVLQVGSLDEIQIGMDVHAVGHPRGEAWSYNKGVVSQIRPRYEWATSDSNAKHMATVIQTQTPINPGNSGGPLFSDAEHVIGINTFLKTGQGLNFAIAPDTILSFVNAEASRMAPRQPLSLAPEKSEASKSKCEWRYYPDRINSDKDNVTPVDTDCTGKPDLYFVTHPNNKEPYAVYVDKKRTGTPQAKILLNVDGKYNFWVFYSEKDGRPSVVGYDYQKNGHIDRYVKLD